MMRVHDERITGTILTQAFDAVPVTFNIDDLAIELKSRGVANSYQAARRLIQRLRKQTLLLSKLGPGKGQGTQLAKGSSMTQEEVAALLVARRWAERLPLSQHRCWKSIQLRSLNVCTCACCGARRPAQHRNGFIYVLEDGAILSGHTRREARPVGPQTRKRMLGED